MKKLFIVIAALSLLGCAHWDQLEPSEKIAVGVGAALIVGALVIRNGQGNTQSQCISTRSLETGCHKRD